MHVPDGLIIGNEPISIFGALLMWIISIGFLVWSWKKVQQNYSHSITALLGVSSAFVFAAQMINFPIIFGTSGHLVGGTLLAMLLGPYAAILSMTIVLLMQAVIFADGGILAFGINVFIMAIVGGLSFYLVKLISRSSNSKARLAFSIFFASWISVITGAIIAGIMIAPAFSEGIFMTIPSMLLYYSIIGLVEGFATTVLLSSIQKIKPSIIGDFSILKEESI